MKSFIGGVGALALCVAAGGAVMLTSPSAPEPRQAPAVQSRTAPASLACGGGFERTLEKGVNVEDIDEDVVESSWAFADPAGAVLTDGEESKDIEGWMDSSELVGTLSSVTATDSIHVAGSSVHVAQAGDTRGMATNPCVAPSSDTWLVGSASAVGTSNQLIVTNPGQTAATITLEAFGSAGRLDLGANATLAVDAMSTERFDLDGVIPGDSRIALRATTDSGTVGISLQQNSLDGATPAGVSFVTGASAAEDLVIPGIMVDEDEDAPVLRLVNPNADTATASVSLIDGEGSEDLPGGSAVTVAPGSVLDLSLDGMDPGEYAVRVLSGEPLAAGVMLSSTDEKSGARDIAWAAQAGSYTKATALYGNAAASLGVLGDSDQAVNVTVTPIMSDGSLGDAEKVTADAGSYTTFALPEDSVGITLESSNPVSAAVTAMPKLAIDWIPLTSFESSQNTQKIALSN